MLKTTDYFLAMLKLTLEYNAQVIKMATLYAGGFSTMKRHHQERVIKDLRNLDKTYSKSLAELVDKMEGQDVKTN